MAERPNGKITDGCTTGKEFKVYKGWCKDNNHGFSKTAKEFRDILAENYDCPYADLIIRRGKGDTFYRTLTLTDEVKEHYAKAYDYDGAELLSA